MANQIIDTLIELKTNVTLLNVGKIILNSLIVFVVFFLIAILIGLNVLIGLIPAIIYLVYALRRDFKKDKFEIVENKFPSLNERLRTVADNITKSNPILDSLKQEVYHKMDTVRVSEFIDFKAITSRLVVLTVLSIAIIFVSFLNVNFENTLGNLVPNLPGLRANSGETVQADLDYISASNINEIYGNKSLAILGTKELDLALNPLQGGTDLSRNSEATEADFEKPSFPEEIYTSYDTAYSESISKDNQEVVKDYFENIAG